MKPKTNFDSILLVTRNFPPRLGGMEKLNWHIADELAKRSKVTVVAPHGAANCGLPGNVEVIEVRLSPFPIFLLEATWRTLHVARSIRPSIVLAGSGLSAPIVWLAARVTSARPVAYLHGLDITAPHTLYRKLWLPFIRRMNQLIVNSHATARLAEFAGIPAERITVLNPGVSIPHLDPSARSRFRTTYGLGDRPILLSVGRLTQRKGILEFISECMPRIVKSYPNCLLLIAGDAPLFALHKANISKENVLATVQSCGVSENVLLVNSPSDTELADIYWGSDVHVFPVLGIPDNPEGFGMVAAEAAAHGLPTIAFAVGGVPDAVQDGVSGRLAEPGDYLGLAEMIMETLSGREEFNAESCRKFARTLEWSLFGERLIQACQFLTPATA